MTRSGLYFAGRRRHYPRMLLFWRIFNRAVLVGLICLVSADAYAWIGPEVPDRLVTSVLLGSMVGLLWAIFGQCVYGLMQ